VLLFRFVAACCPGSLSTDGLLVVRVIAAAENSTPARIAQLAAEAQVRSSRLSEAAGPEGRTTVFMHAMACIKPTTEEQTVHATAFNSYLEPPTQMA